MKYTIWSTPEFDEDFEKVDYSIAKRISEKIEWLAANPQVLKSAVKYIPDDLKGLQKYRVGAWRILLWVDKENHWLVLYGVEHRGTIYKSLGRHAKKAGPYGLKEWNKRIQ